jgi:glycosyltransferase involved in cell wall biosynthesis
MRAVERRAMGPGGGSSLTRPLGLSDHDRVSAAIPLVSIVTPSLNQGRFIEATIQSVQAQDYPRVEHLVVDGGSQDETLEVLARHAAGLRWVSGPDGGQTEAINRGFRMTSGEILSWLNADDVLLPGAVRAVVAAFQAQPDAMMVYGDGLLIDEDGRAVEPFRFTEPFNWRRLVEVHDYILQPTAFVRRRALEAVGYLDESLTWAMDWDLWIRIGERFPVHYLPTAVAQARVHPESKTSRAGLAKLVEMHRIVRAHTRRRIPPALVIHGAGTLYRMARRALRRQPERPVPVGEEPPGSLVTWARRWVDRVIETGQLPWERTPDPALRRQPLSDRPRA